MITTNSSYTSPHPWILKSIGCVRCWTRNQKSEEHSKRGATQCTGILGHGVREGLPELSDKAGDIPGRRNRRSGGREEHRDNEELKDKILGTQRAREECDVPRNGRVLKDLKDTIDKLGLYTKRMGNQ